MTMLNQEAADFEKRRAEEAGGKLADYVNEDTMVGDLLSLDYGEAIVLVHDSLSPNPPKIMT